VIAKMKIPDGKRFYSSGWRKQAGRGTLSTDCKRSEPLAGAVLGESEPNYGKTGQGQARVIVWKRSPEPLA
jgi:hypothetical protein